MTKTPEHVDDEKAPALAALQAMKYEEDDPKGLFVNFGCSL